MYVIDEVDLKIVELLQENARMTLKDISQHVYLTSPAVSARIDKLERCGIIEGYHAHINREAFQLQLLFSGLADHDSVNGTPLRTEAEAVARTAGKQGLRRVI